MIYRNFRQASLSVKGVLERVSDFFWPVRVYYEDTDSGGVVYYANYLRVMERARTERLRTLGVEQRALSREQGMIFAVRSVQVEFLKPAHLDDPLRVTADVAECRRASLVFDQAIHHAGDAGRVFCTASVRIVCLDATSLRPRPIPDFILQELACGR